MEYIICCLCSLLCFLCGAWAAGGGARLPQKKRRQELSDLTAAEDALSRDIAALLAYTPGKEEPHEDC